MSSRTLITERTNPPSQHRNATYQWWRFCSPILDRFVPFQPPTSDGCLWTFASPVTNKLLTRVLLIAMPASALSRHALPWHLQERLLYGSMSPSPVVIQQRREPDVVFNLIPMGNLYVRTDPNWQIQQLYNGPTTIMARSPPRPALISAPTVSPGRHPVQPPSIVRLPNPKLKANPATAPKSTVPKRHSLSSCPMDLLADVASAVDKIEGINRMSPPSSTSYASPQRPIGNKGSPTTELPRRVSLSPSCSSASSLSSSGSLMDRSLPMDVVFSTGSAVESRPGNRLYRTLIDLNHRRYGQSISSQEKSFVIRSVLANLEERGCRFLQRRAAGFLPMTHKAVYNRIRSELDKPFQGPPRTLLSAAVAASYRRETESSATKKASSGPRLSNPGPPGRLVQPFREPRTPDQSGPRPAEPHPNDVVLGRGNNIANHPGNLLFRQLVLEQKGAYNAAPRQEKGVIASSIVERVRCLDPPGRFLELGDDGLFRDVQEHRVLEKTCQACRERKWGSAPPPHEGRSPADKPRNEE